MIQLHPRIAPLVAAALAASCSGTGAGRDFDADALPNDVGVFVTESSKSLDSAAIEVVEPGTHRRVTVSGFGLGSDLQLRRLVDPDGRERIFTIDSGKGVVVERDRDAQVVRTFDAFDPELGAARANPLDVAIARDGSLWITRSFLKSVLVLEPDGTRRATIDLSSFADADGNPDMSAIAIVDSTAYVALRRLTSGFDPVERSTVVAIDVTTHAAAPFVELPAKDPGAEFRARGGALWISCIGGPLSSPPNQEAGLVRIDLATRTATNVLDVAAAGGFVTAFDFADDQTGFAIVASYADDNPTALRRFDPTTGVLEEPFAATAGYTLWDVAVVRGTDLLLVADRNEESPGLRVLSQTTGIREGFVPTQLPPIEVLVLR